MIWRCTPKLPRVSGMILPIESISTLPGIRGMPWSPDILLEAVRAVGTTRDEALARLAEGGCDFGEPAT